MSDGAPDSVNVAGMGQNATRGRGHNATTLPFAHSTSMGVETVILTEHGDLSQLGVSILNGTVASEEQSAVSVELGEALADGNMV